MARFRAFSPVNLDNFNLYFYESNFDGSEILDSENTFWSAEEFTTATYSDFFYGYGLSDTDVSWALGAGGADLYYDGFASGTANALSEWNRISGTWVIDWIFDGISIELSDLIEAVITPTALDDLTLLAEALSGNDSIRLSEFDDVFSGFGGRDTIDGRAGNDILYGERGADKVNGGTGNDDIYGGSGNDKLFGDANDDFLSGGTGNDTLQGGKGVDWAAGGPGSDKFVYRNINEAPVGSSYDTISYLSSGDDLIVLSGIDADTSASAPGNQAFTFLGTAAFDGAAGRLRYDIIDADSDGFVDDILIVGTVDADMIADFAIAVLNRTSITATDFIL